MKIKINEKVICFPPYISTTWDNVKSLRVELDSSSHIEVLVITLTDGYRIKIPNLEEKIIHAIFGAHLKYIEQKTETFSLEKETSLAKKIPLGPDSELNNPAAGFGFLKFGISGLEGLGAALQHNPSQYDTPPLPAEILNKIAAIAKIVGNEDIAAMPQPEKNCNCIHCQIAKAIHQGIGENENTLDLDEEVTEQDLKFRIWDISQNGEKLYTVTNPLDANEQYNVYLGDPIGCTCGQKKCEHIRAVLNS
jgi:hypothetical protein